MLFRSTRSFYPLIATRLASSYTTTTLPESKLTLSYDYTASNVPLLYHTLGQHLDQLAQTYPNHECYVFRAEGKKRYTYKSFLDEVDSLAASLIDLGFEKGDRIGVWLPNTSQSCAMSYAATKVGIIKVIFFKTKTKQNTTSNSHCRSILIQHIWIVN